MNKLKYIKLLPMLMLFPLAGLAQESKVSLNGYVKELYMFYSPETPIPGFDVNNLGMNILHNRLNFKWYTSSKFTTVVEMRTRLMYGNLVKDYPDYQSTVNVDNGLVKSIVDHRERYRLVCSFHVRPRLCGLYFRKMAGSHRKAACELGHKLRMEPQRHFQYLFLFRLRL